MKKNSVRPETLTDIEQVYALIANQNIHDYGDAQLSLEDLRNAWRNVHFETDTCMAYADGELQGYAELLEGDSPFVYLADINDIDLGFQLLNILEEIAIERKIHTLSTRISTKNQTLLELFLLNGYHSVLVFITMEYVMDKPPAAAECPEGITVRCFVPGQDEQGTYITDEEASQDKGYHAPFDYATWAKRMGLNLERFDPSLWFLACAGRSTEIVGVALNFYDTRTQTGWVDHLGVRRLWRNQGIGKALILHTFGEFYQRGVDIVNLRVDANSMTNAPRLYESVVMKTKQEYHIYKKDLPV